MAETAAILTALEEAGGELTYPDLLDALPKPVSGVALDVERLRREGHVTMHDAGRPDRRPWQPSGYGCAACEPTCDECNCGPLLVRLNG